MAKYKGYQKQFSIPDEIKNSFMNAIGVQNPSTPLQSPVSENDTLDDPGKLYYVAQQQAADQAAQQQNLATTPSSDNTITPAAVTPAPTDQTTPTQYQVKVTAPGGAAGGSIMRAINNTKSSDWKHGPIYDDTQGGKMIDPGNLDDSGNSASMKYIPPDPNSNWGNFVQTAQKIAQQSGFPLAVLLGQAAIETGRSAKNAPGNNWFGMKGTGTAGSNNLATQEADAQGNYYNTKSNFAAFSNMEDSINAYINLIKNNFPQAYAQRSNPVSMINAIKAGGYATSPTYAQNVMGTPEFKQYMGQPSGLSQNQQPNFRQPPPSTPPPANHLVSPVYHRNFTTPTPQQPRQQNPNYVSPLAQNVQQPPQQAQPKPQQQQPNAFQQFGNAVSGAAKGVGSFLSGL